MPILARKAVSANGDAARISIGSLPAFVVVWISSRVVVDGVIKGDGGEYVSRVVVAKLVFILL